jgi:hypothetical protein
MIALGEYLEVTRKERFMGWYHSHRTYDFPLLLAFSDCMLLLCSSIRSGTEFPLLLVADRLVHPVAVATSGRSPRESVCGDCP